MDHQDRYLNSQREAARRPKRQIYEGPLCVIPRGTSVGEVQTLVRTFWESIRSTPHDPVFCDFLDGLAILIADIMLEGTPSIEADPSVTTEDS